MSSARTEILARIKSELLRKAAGECLEVAEIFNASKAKIERSDHYTPKGRDQALTNLLATESGPAFRKAQAPIAKAMADATVWQLAREALFFESAKLGRADLNRIMSALERLGWRRLARVNSSRPWER